MFEGKRASTTAGVERIFDVPTRYLGEGRPPLEPLPKAKAPGSIRRSRRRRSSLSLGAPPAAIALVPVRRQRGIYGGEEKKTRQIRSFFNPTLARLTDGRPCEKSDHSVDRLLGN